VPMLFIQLTFEAITRKTNKRNNTIFFQYTKA